MWYSHQRRLRTVDRCEQVQLPGCWCRQRQHSAAAAAGATTVCCVEQAVVWVYTAQRRSPSKTDHTVLFLSTNHRGAVCTVRDRLLISAATRPHNLVRCFSPVAFGASRFTHYTGFLLQCSVRSSFSDCGSCGLRSSQLTFGLEVCMGMGIPMGIPLEWE